MEYITKRRKEELKPKFEKLLPWLEEIEPRNKGKYSMNRAIQYVLNNKEGLMEFTNDAIISHDNTSCERSIRSFVVIRNRCKFSVSVHGAQASAMTYSLVISCIENKQNPYMYLTHLFENLPKLDLTNKEELRMYLPYSRELPIYIRTLSKSEIKKSSLMKPNHKCDAARMALFYIRKQFICTTFKLCAGHGMSSVGDKPTTGSYRQV